MPALVRIGSWAAAAAVLVALAVGWLGGSGHLSADDAADVAIGSFESVGFEATLESAPAVETHTSEQGTDIEVWAVFLRVAVEEDSPVIDGSNESAAGGDTAGGEIVELRVQRSGGQLVYLDDRTGEGGTSRLLDDEEFARLEDFRKDPPRDDRIRRNTAASVGGTILVVICAVLATRSRRVLETT